MVLAILVLLAVLGAAVAQQAQLAGRKVADASNLRQIAGATLLYSNDHQGWLPATSHNTVSESWIYSLEEYLGPAFQEVRLSPADPRLEEKRRGHGTSYVLNEYTSVDLRSPFGEVLQSFRNLLALSSPAETVTVLPASERMGLSSLNDHTHSRNWHKGWSAVLADIAPDLLHIGKSAPDRTVGSANYAFADGHVEEIPASRLKAWFDAGRNFAEPPDARPVAP